MNGEIINFGNHKEIPKEPIEQEDCFELKIDRIYIKISQINRALKKEIPRKQTEQFKYLREELIQIIEKSYKEEFGDEWEQKLHEKIEELKKVSVHIDKTKD